MMLLQTEHLRNAPEHPMERLCVNGRIAGSVFVLLCQQDGRAEGIHLILPLPHGGVPFRLILKALSVGFPVEGVGVSIDQHVLDLRGDHAPQKRTHLLVLCGEGQIILDLRGGIPQPHGGNIAGDDEGLSARKGLHGGLHRAQKAGLRQRGQRGIVPGVILFQFFRVGQQTFGGLHSSFSFT